MEQQDCLGHEIPNKNYLGFVEKRSNKREPLATTGLRTPNHHAWCKC